MNPDFWSGKKVLITGHTGFKGSWLSLWLQKSNASVVGYALPPPTTPSLFEVARVAENMCSLEGDVRDLNLLQSVVSEHKPDIVIHMAAQALVRYSYESPVETYASNVMGTVNVLEAVRGYPGVRAVLNITSDKCYENREWVWGYRENDPMGGYDPYSSSKGCAELVTSAYRNSFFSNDDNDTVIASARAGNVIGGGDWASDRLIPDIMQAFMNNQAVAIRNPASIRPWQHVLEPLNGYLTLLEKMYESGKQFGEAWNFGPDDTDAKPVSWIVERLADTWGNNAKFEFGAENQVHEAQYLKLDCSKSNSLLDWKTKLQLSDALGWIVEWYLSYQRDQDMREYTENEITRYEQK